MKIWVIQRAESLPIERNVSKMRTAMLVDELIKNGHSVVWWTSAFDHFKKKWRFKKDTTLKITKSFEIVALKGIGYKKNISLRRFVDHRILAKKFKKSFHKALKPDVIIASTPNHDLAYEAVVYAKKNNIPIIVDVRDPWPDIFLEHIPKNFRKIFKLLFRKDFKMIRFVLQRADGIIAVTENMFKWGLKYAGREKNKYDKIIPLGYKKYENKTEADVKKRFRNIERSLNKKFIVLFIGTITKSYHNPSIILKAAKKLSRNKNIHFVISGDGEAFIELKNKASSLNNVTLTGWVNQPEKEFLLKHSNLGICPSIKSVNLPSNKVPCYLSAGLPVLSSFGGEIKKIIEKYKIGFFYPPNDLDTLVGYIKKLYQNPPLYKKISINAINIFNKMFDANKIYQEYARCIENLVKKYK